MKISTKGRYGLRAIIDLAANNEGSHLSLSHISRRQGISIHYLEQFFLSMKRAGLVDSVKGAAGGYYLCVDVYKLPVSEVLKVLEGEFSFAESSVSVKEQSTYQTYIEDYVWKVIDNDVNDAINTMTVGNLVDYYKSVK